MAKLLLYDEYEHLCLEINASVNFQNSNATFQTEDGNTSYILPWLNIKRMEVTNRQSIPVYSVYLKEY